jgi:Ca2+-binding EF-hand superfamily protein
LVLKILPGIKMAEIERIFNYIDANGDKNVSFDEFFNTFSASNGHSVNNKSSSFIIKESQKIIN